MCDYNNNLVGFPDDDASPEIFNEFLLLLDMQALLLYEFFPR